MIRTIFITISISLVMLVPVESRTVGREGKIWQEKDDAKREVLRLHQRFIEAVSKHDVKTMESLLADDYFVTGSEGKTFDKTSAVAINKQDEVEVEMKEADVTARQFGETVVVTGTINWKVTTKENVLTGQERYTEVWTKRKMGWQLSVAHATKVQ